MPHAVPDQPQFITITPTIAPSQWADAIERAGMTEQLSVNNDMQLEITGDPLEIIARLVGGPVMLNYVEATMVLPSHADALNRARQTLTALREDVRGPDLPHAVHSLDGVIEALDQTIPVLCGDRS